MRSADKQRPDHFKGGSNNTVTSHHVFSKSEYKTRQKWKNGCCFRERKPEWIHARQAGHPPARSRPTYTSTHCCGSLNLIALASRLIKICCARGECLGERSIKEKIAKFFSFFLRVMLSNSMRTHDRSTPPPPRWHLLFSSRLCFGQSILAHFPTEQQIFRKPAKPTGEISHL
jgi:hypothetical protein